MKAFQIIFVTCVTFMCNCVHGQVAVTCVHLTEGKNSRLLKNICNQPITIFMCHDAPSPVGTSDSECGRKGRLYQMHFELSPGELGGNRFESPFGSMIAYGACFGSIFSKPYTVIGDAGAYECKVLKTNRGLGLESTTSRGKTQVEACSNARVAAGSPAAPCSCNGEEGKRIICKVTALREKQQPTATEEARDAMHQILKEACTKSGDCSTQRTSAMANRG